MNACEQICTSESQQNPSVAETATISVSLLGENNAEFLFNVPSHQSTTTTPNNFRQPVNEDHPAHENPPDFSNLLQSFRAYDDTFNDSMNEIDCLPQVAEIVSNSLLETQSSILATASSTMNALAEVSFCGTSYEFLSEEDLSPPPTPGKGLENEK